MPDHIQIGDTSPRVQYTADGVQTAFTYPFPIFKAADLEVYFGAAEQSAGFTIAGAGETAGGTVTFAVAPAAATLVTLRRRLAIQRTSDFQADGVIRAKTLNDELDILTACVQQVAEDLGRAVTRSPTSPSTADLTLPEPVAGRAVKWNADGTGLVNAANDPDAVAAAVASDAAQVAADRLVVAADKDVAVTAAATASAAAIAAEEAAASVGDPLQAGQNLADLPDAAAARSSLDVLSSSEVAAAVAANLPAGLIDRLAFLETNLAINTLRDLIATGNPYYLLAKGVADEFEDETGIATKTGATYDATGDYYHNRGGEVLTNIGTATVYNNYSASTNLYNGVTSADHTNGGYTPIPAGGSYFAVKYAAAQTFTKWRIYAPSNTDPSLGNAVPAQYTVSVSSDSTNGVDGTWVQAGQSASVVIAAGSYLDIALTPGAAYTWIKQTIATAYASSLYFAEFQAYAAEPDANIVIVSVAHAADGYTVGAPPVEARLVLLHQPVDPVTLDADCTLEGSRDGGATWTAGALTDEGSFDAATNILSATVDLSGQPAGVSMAWRFKTFNAKEQRLHGVWMQWR